MKESFVHLHVHSHYSFMKGTSSVEELCEASTKAGFEHIALTDTNGFYGLMNWLQTARQFKLAPIVGAHLEHKDEKAVLLARTPKGYEIISDLLTRKHQNEDFSLAREMPNSNGHLAMLTADPVLLKSIPPRADCYVELVPGNGMKISHSIAHELNIPLVATNAVYLAKPDDFTLHKLLALSNLII